MSPRIGAIARRRVTGDHGPRVVAARHYPRTGDSRGLAWGKMTRSATQMQVLHAARDAALSSCAATGRCSTNSDRCSQQRGTRWTWWGLGARCDPRPGVEDLDFATDARPEQVIALVRPWADAVWDVGARFGTIGAESNGMRLEFTTYRSDRYDAQSRKPQVEYGADLPPTWAAGISR